MKQDLIQKAYDLAKEQYAGYGIDTDKVIQALQDVIISLHCWQTDDVAGLEKPDSSLDGGGIQVTGNYPGKARNADEMRQDFDKVFSLLPGRQKLNLHAIYGEFGGKLVDRNQIEAKHYQGWIDWAKGHKTGLDFNATCFSHPKADDGFTLSSKNKEIRSFWVEHVKRCRKISAEMGKQTGITCVHNTWIPDGSKDIPVDRNGHRELLKLSLDEILKEKLPEEHMKDAVESKLFGIGSEAMVVGSYDFYLGYAIKNNILICLDNGHYHPTEQVGDKISSCLQFVDKILLHLTRGIRWDSDHVLTFNEELLLIAQEIVRCNALSRMFIGLDFFDASINRIGAYVTGARAALKAFLFALLEPVNILLDYEESGKNFERLFLMEKMKSMPWGAVWDYYCVQNGVPADDIIINDIQQYEKEVLSKR